MKVEMNGNNNINIGDPSSIKKPVYDVSGYTTNLAVMLVTLPFFLFNDLSMELNLKVKPLIILRGTIILRQQLDGTWHMVIEHL